MQATTGLRPSFPFSDRIPVNRGDERDSKQRFDAIRIQLASPEIIRSWSSGEVTKPETINYRSFKPEKDGLFCERIFGPVKDWECNCGKYKRIRYRGVICDRCGVEVTQAKVRRERLGNIELAVPVSHIWYFKSVPSRIGHLLDMSVRDLERVLYYESYIVLDPGNTNLKSGQLLSEDEHQELIEEPDNEFEAKMGGEAVRQLLAAVDLDELSADLKSRVKVETSVQRKKEILKRLRTIEAFRQSGNRPEWMILTVIPVLPPDLRPLVPLEGGRFATSDLNDLYRRVINRNNRLKKLMEIKAPQVILRNEKRMLQEAVDALFDNSRGSRAVRGQGNRPLKSLSDMLKGKQGRFRQNLLGKRVDYSGRSVIVVGPELRLHECGLPKNMALELFKPFIIKRLEDRGYVQTVKSAKKLVERERPEVWDILSEIIKDHPVMLNRAPTLHRLGIQAFQPVLVEGKAIRIHPLVCAAFNADFDGDQMAVHVPLSYEAQIETRELMYASNNILLPASGRPIAAPSQDIVLGCYYITKERPGDIGEGKIFSSPGEVRIAHDHGQVGLHARIKVRRRGELHDTTVGRVLFSEILPPGIEVPDKPLSKKDLERLVHRCYYQMGSRVTARFLDELKEIGFSKATEAGITVGVDDLLIPEEKASIIDKTQADVDEIYAQYRAKDITDSERYNKIIDAWTHATTEVEQVTFEGLGRDRDGFNPIHMMAASGARGSAEQIRQLAGMRGLMAKPQKKLTGGMGEIIENPVIRNFKEGLSVLEYFISTHGARKGLADTALKTADAGYLTRRLVDVAQDAIITEVDCGTIRGLEVTAIKEGEEVIEPLADRILGRVATGDVVAPISGEVMAEAGDEIEETIAQRIEEAGVERVEIRSVLTCESRSGVCAKCYGRNLATGQMVSIGEAVGVIGAQSIGEPGTQLTLRTFHIGGTASRIVEQARIPAKCDGSVNYINVNHVETGDGRRMVVGHKGEIELLDTEGRVRYRYSPPHGSVLLVGEGEPLKLGQEIYEWDPHNLIIFTIYDGTVRYGDIRDKVTVRDEIDQQSGQRLQVIIDDREKVLHPHIEILDAEGTKIGHYPLPTGALLEVKDGQQVKVGDALAKIPRSTAKTRDITGGLPRVSELFEARKPKDAATVSEIDGAISFGQETRGMRKIVVTSQTGDEREYLVPHGKHLRVQEGDQVRAGERLTEGPVNPHDILKIKGIKEVQEYLLDEIQEVYRLQGVDIDDKHVEVIVRQMLQKVRIEDPGDTRFLEGDEVDKIELQEEQERVVMEGGQPATFQPLLLGITKASLRTQSFISAASFQETTRVLTEASIQGKLDPLRGLKENVTIGYLIPAGTGLNKYRRMRVFEPQELYEEADVLEADQTPEPPRMPESPEAAGVRSA
ncbi:MAG: DNA-directed RNA polymerase subunit beta' [Candidatus Eiseniibacteriota bacterium]